MMDSDEQQPASVVLDHDARETAPTLTGVQQEICRRIMEGESVRSICTDASMPSKSTVMNWLAREPEFRAAYSFAKQLLAETLAEEVIEISDDASADWSMGETGQEFNHEHVQRARLRVDSRKWLAAKLAPKRYGDSSMLQIGQAESAPRPEMSESERYARLASIMAEALKRKAES